MHTPPFDIHISYTRAERDLAAALARRLEDCGIPSQYDARIGPAPALRPEEGPEQARMLVILLSPEAHDPNLLARQLAAADRLGRPVIVLLLEDVTPKGGALMALADRIAVRVYPDPMLRLDEIVSFLQQLTGRSGPATGSGGVKAVSGSTGPPPGEAPACVTEAIREDAMRAPRMTEAYVGMAPSPGLLTGAGGTFARIASLGAYGLLARQRAIRRFRANSRKL